MKRREGNGPVAAKVGHKHQKASAGEVSKEKVELLIYTEGGGALFRYLHDEDDGSRCFIPNTFSDESEAVFLDAPLAKKTARKMMLEQKGRFTCDNQRYRGLRGIVFDDFGQMKAGLKALVSAIVESRTTRRLQAQEARQPGFVAVSA